MELKTKVNAEDQKQDLVVTREFDLPVELLFKAYEDPEIVGQWMSTNVVKHESKKHGSWQFETKDPKGNVVFRANGVFHEFSPNRKIVRTFEMENAAFGVQLEILDFERLTDDTSKLTMHIIYESIGRRNQMLQLPFAKGLSMAHDRIQEVMNKLK